MEVNKEVVIDREKAIYLIDCVLDFFSKTRPLANPDSSMYDIQKETMDNFNVIIQYKRDQVERLIKGKTTFTWEEIMMFVSCPLKVTNAGDIHDYHYGIKTRDYPNGVLNDSLSKNILRYAILYRNLGLESNLPDNEDVTVINTQDLIDHYSPGMISNNALLLYMFMTGRGEEFTQKFRNPELLKKIDDFDRKVNNDPELEFELKDKCPVMSYPRELELNGEYLSLLKADLSFIQENKFRKRGTRVPTSNRLVR